MTSLYQHATKLCTFEKSMLIIPDFTLLSTFLSFSSQLSKAKTSEGHFQSQIDHSTQGKPLKKASRRPREQNCLCSGRPISNPAVRKPAIKPARLLAPGCPGRITRRQTTWRGPYRPTPFVRRPHVARNTNRIFDIYLIRNLWTLLESWLVSVKLGRVY